MIDHNEVFEALSDFENQLLEKLTAEKVRFLVVGGYAVRYHGHLRTTDDLDLFVDCGEDNVERICRVLNTMGAVKLDEMRKKFIRPGCKVCWNDVEFFSSMNGLSFENLYSESIWCTIGSVQVRVMSKAHLLHAKEIALKATDRSEKWHIDREDYSNLTGQHDA